MNSRAPIGAQGSGLIYFSSVPFDSYAQRPHFMASAFADHGFDKVMWIDPYPTRLPTFADFSRLGTRPPAPSHANDSRILVLRPSALPIEPLPMAGLINRIVAWRPVLVQVIEFARGTEHCVLAIGRPSKLAEWALTHVPHQRSFADILDNFPAFYRGISRCAMRIRMRAICRKVTDVYCSSSQLALELSPIRRDAVVVLNGYRTDNLPLPSPSGKRKYIGYVGTIGEWFDWPLVRSLAAALPDVPIRLIGPEFVARPADLPANIECLGERPQDEIAALVGEFAVGLIPFRINDLTAGVDPIKFYEYRCMGVPVWSTRFGEMRTRTAADGVHHIAHDSIWQHLWDAANRSDHGFPGLAEFRANVSWSKRFEPILARARMASAERDAAQPFVHGGFPVTRDSHSTQTSHLTRQHNGRE
ncbi:glycosyltransferase [Paraburkholderia sp. BL25I1N1]|uniref:glycosyltransferase n=1 Tax=Paraburkholderia sp. BL25I1N1 TaxID=1938804 RepID=UPI000D056CCC|nr:glycosyltransferase [Paraburkholderia sp. BL25I1N1]PRY09160.1 glycosyltransferase involved in cell wall biosynthesis [Paraburkholderia sp. BL25I1N1]